MMRAKLVATSLCAGVLVAAQPAAAGVEPTPFVNFNPVSGVSSPQFEVTLPPDSTGAVIPVELLSLMLTAPTTGVSVLGRVGPLNHSAIVQVGQLSGATPDDNMPISFALELDVTSFMGAAPVLGVDPEPFVPPDPIRNFDVLFDVFIDGGVVHHTASFAAGGDATFDNIQVGVGSILIDFDLIGPFDNEFFSVTLTASAAPIPEAAASALFGVALAGLGATARRRRKAD